MSSASLIERAQMLADEVLFPAALATDAADLVPRANLDAIAAAGLYGLFGPAAAGGLDADSATASAVVEALAGGCLNTTFVFMQHHSVVSAMTTSPNAALRDEWLAPLCRGERRGGIVFGGLRAGPSQLVASETEGGWLLQGTVPWVTGWGRVDAIMAAARTADGRVVRALAEPAASEYLGVRPLRLVAANASGTVELSFRSLVVPAESVVSIEPYRAPPDYDGGGRRNGSLALGVANRCLRLAGPSALDAELVARREQLDAATEETMAPARAAAAELAMRAAAYHIASAGSRSLLVEQHAQRLAREALFCLVFGTRPAIRASLLERLGG